MHNAHGSNSFIYINRFFFSIKLQDWVVVQKMATLLLLFCAYDHSKAGWDFYGHCWA